MTWTLFEKVIKFRMKLSEVNWRMPTKSIHDMSREELRDICQVFDFEFDSRKNTDKARTTLALKLFDFFAKTLNIEDMVVCSNVTTYQVRSLKEGLVNGKVSSVRIHPSKWRF